MLYDTHCHLDAKRFDNDRGEMLTRARERGVKRFLTIGCDVANSLRAQGLAWTHRDIFFSAGVHPHEADKVDGDYIAALEPLTHDPKCLAVGECGLDYFYDHSPRDAQRDVFRAQIALAKACSLPLVVHVRDAWADCLEDLRSEAAAGGVIHCFTGTQANARDALALGFYISIPGIVTFSKPGDIPDVVKFVPEDRLLIETDSPYLAPKPHRGKRNEPAYVHHVAEAVAALRGWSYEETLSKTAANARALFRMERRPPA